MNFYVPLIAVGVAAIWYYLKNAAGISTLPNVPLRRGRDTQNTSFAAPGITGQPGDSTVAASGPVTNQPAASSSGVPAYTAQAREFGNTQPGYVTGLQPFYGAHRELFIPRALARATQPYDPRSENKKGCGGGCGGCSKSPTCPGSSRYASRTDGAGGCGAAPSADQLTANRPIAIQYLRADPAAPPPTTSLAGQVLNLTHVLANPFNAYQSLEFQAEEKAGGVPAAPTYHF